MRYTRFAPFPRVPYSSSREKYPLVPHARGDESRTDVNLSIRPGSLLLFFLLAANCLPPLLLLLLLLAGCSSKPDRETMMRNGGYLNTFSQPVSPGHVEAQRLLEQQALKKSPIDRIMWQKYLIFSPTEKPTCPAPPKSEVCLNW